MAGSIALLCVWFSNGLWHGAAWHYVAFGLYHFVLILMGNIFAPYLKKVNDRLGLSSEKKLFHLWQMLRTTVLVIFGELIFRADSMSHGLYSAEEHLRPFRSHRLCLQRSEGRSLRRRLRRAGIC